MATKASETKSKRNNPTSYSQERWQIIFEYSPIAIWEEDFTAVAKLGVYLKKNKVTDIYSYLYNHKNLIKETYRQIKVLNVNKAALELYGASTKNQLRAQFGKTFHPNEIKVLMEEFSALIDGKMYFEADYKCKTLKGQTKEVHMRVSVPTMYKDNLKRVIVSLQDMTLVKKQQRYLEKMAQTDGLTEVLNHKAILTRLEEEFKRADRYEKKLSCMMVDMDHFKGINDLCGHQKGDVVLKRTAQALTANIREVDILGRYGGDEFLIILPETSPQNATVVAKRLVDHFQKLADLKSGPVFSTISIGVAGGPNERVHEFKELLTAVDKAMYSAKKAGRNTFVVK